MENNVGIESELIVLTKATMDRFLKEDNPSNLISLYMFYYYTAKWQKTNQPKATIAYASKALRYSAVTIRKYKKRLSEMGLIEDICKKNKDGRVAGWYIKLNYILKESTLKENVRVVKENHPSEKPQCGADHTVENLDPNALSNNSLNALSNNSLNALSTISKNGNNNTTLLVSDDLTVPSTRLWFVWHNLAGGLGGRKSGNFLQEVNKMVTNFGIDMVEKMIQAYWSKENLENREKCSSSHWVWFKNEIPLMFKLAKGEKVSGKKTKIAQDENWENIKKTNIG
jgi:hypothetical protein